MSTKTIHDYRVVKTFINGRHTETEYFFSNGMVYKTSETRRAVWKREDKSVSAYGKDSYAGEVLAKLLATSRCLSETEDHRTRIGGNGAASTVHERGTALAEIKRPSRKGLIFFKCPQHHNARYKSRDPWISAWVMQDMVSKPCPESCDVPLDKMVLTADYAEDND